MNQHIHEILYNIIPTHLKFYDKHTFQKMNKCTDKIYVQCCGQKYLEMQLRLIIVFLVICKLRRKNDFSL